MTHLKLNLGAPAPQLTKLVQSVASKLIFNAIERKEETPYGFYQLLLLLQREVNLEDIHSDPDSLNPLHAIVANKRLSLILPLVHRKLFPAYFNEIIPDTSPSCHRGKTPHDLAESKPRRSKMFCKSTITWWTAWANSWKRVIMETYCQSATWLNCRKQWSAIKI